MRPKVRKKFIIWVLMLTFFTANCGSKLMRVPTGAMLPTINVDALILIDETAYSAGRKIERFDIVIHQAPITESDRKSFGFDENTRFVFRIIGLSGEKVEIKKGQVFINDELLNEPFDKIPSKDDFGPFTVPENQYFLLGDNRPNSNDGRFWKPAGIKRQEIFGKVVQIF